MHTSYRKQSPQIGEEATVIKNNHLHHRRPRHHRYLRHNYIDWCTCFHSYCRHYIVAIVIVVIAIVTVVISTMLQLVLPLSSLQLP